MNKEQVEELAFKDRRELANLNVIDLLDIIELLQKDRKQWIYQFTNTFNESIKINETALSLYKENKELNKQLEEINKMIENCIENLQQENKQLKDNWNKLKEYLNYKSERAVGEDEYIYDEIYNEMQELEQGSNSNG